jgi:hypothetical protein
MSPVPAVRLNFPDPAGLRAVYEEQLSKGRIFLPGAAGMSERTVCAVLVEHGGQTIRLVAEVVFVRALDPGRGVGLQLAPLDEAASAELRAFVEAASGDAPPGEHEPPRDTVASEGEGIHGDIPGEDEAPAHLHERMRALSGPEQQRIAAGGSMPERVMLERIYGPNVWETLLRNTRLTIPEVARIARKATLPRPLVETIAANNAWIGSPEVQRALLSNPRSSAGVVSKILQAMPKMELQRVPQQTAYPMAVRQAAKRMVSGK